MDWATFTSNIVDSLAWPVAVIIIAIVFRNDLRNLLPELKLAKWGDKELQFQKQVHHLASEAAPTLVSTGRPQSDSTKKPPVDETESFDPAYRALEFSPRAAVLEAWLELEAAIQHVYTTYIDLKPPRHVSPKRMAETLTRERFFSETDQRLLEELWQLRNTAVHDSTLSVDSHTGMTYIELARRLANTVRQRLTERERKE